MGLIANGGNAKSLAFEAIRLAKVGRSRQVPA
ncbi:PTS lactose/cellobiose transporter subunit IIA [Lactobacillus delbrueckii subsp. bulgaricus]|nr:PTS lactose/cellobiose transporter subunit IIA [Lactobacillus delbrueckii subsp. bulgaricus]UBV29815.1 PTS lactose/cellobiose transporter subunit IIA [Lactobacillus delbrueckii subsp. lactis]